MRNKNMLIPRKPKEKITYSKLTYEMIEKYLIECFYGKAKDKVKQRSILTDKD